MQIHEFVGEEFDEVASKFFIAMNARTRPDFRGRVAFRDLGEAVTLCQSHWRGPLRAVRTDRIAGKASVSNLMLFCVQLAGKSTNWQHDRFAELPADSGLLVEARSPYKWISSTETRSVTLRFPRELLPLRSIEVTDACARTVDPAAPAMKMLSGYLARLLEVAEDLSAPQRQDAGRAAIDLLAMALRDAAPSVASGEGSAGVLLDMMRMHIRDHLADPLLRVEELAQRHHVSVRHVYNLFERIGTTPGAYLREQRLIAARAMLSDSNYARFGISNVATAVGFLDLTTFYRAFRRQYGTTPDSWRRGHLRPGPVT